MSDTPAPAPDATPAPSDGGQPGGAQPQINPGATNPTNPSPAPAVTPPPSPAPTPSPANPGDTRLEDQLNGMRREIYDPLKERGYGNRASIQKLMDDAEKYNQLQSTGISIDALLNGAQQTQQQQTQPQYLTEDRFLHLQEMGKAKDAHEQSLTTMNAGIKKVQVDLGGGGEEGAAFAQPYVRQALTEYLQSNGQRYPDHHPLAGTMMPLTQPQIDAVMASAQEKIDKARGFLMRQSTTQPNQVAQPPINPGQTMQGASGGGQLSGRALLEAKQEEAMRRSVQAGQTLRQGMTG